MEFYGRKDKYLRALFGAYGSMHFLGRMKEELAQRMETQLSGIRDEIKPYVMEYHIFPKHQPKRNGVQSVVHVNFIKREIRKYSFFLKTDILWKHCRSNTDWHKAH